MSIISHAPLRHHRNAAEDNASLSQALGIKSHIAATIGFILALVGLAISVLQELSVLSLVAILIIAIGSLCAVRSIVTDSQRRHLASEPSAPSTLTIITAVTCTVAILACIGTTAYGLFASTPSFILNRTWVLENGEWTKNGRVVSFTKGLSAPGITSSASAASGTGVTSANSDSTGSSGSAVSTQPSSTPSPSLSGLSLTNLPQAVLFTGSNLTGETVQHNNTLTDTDSAQSLAIESVTIDNHIYGYYNGKMTLRNNTGETILYADVALTALSGNGDVLKQDTAHCMGPIEAGQTCEAAFQIGSSNARAIMPYTTMWFTSGDASAAKEAATNDSEQHQDAAASRTAPGTVFHKASPGVPAIPL